MKTLACIGNYIVTHTMKVTNVVCRRKKGDDKTWLEVVINY